MGRKYRGAPPRGTHSLETPKEEEDGQSISRTEAPVGKNKSRGTEPQAPTQAGGRRAPCFLRWEGS